MQNQRDRIVSFCQQYLKTDTFSDYCHNGLQVEGSASVTRIVTGVSYSRRLVEAAIEKKASMILVHHGIFADAFGEKPSISGIQRSRLALLLKHDISLCGFHLPLDAHPQTGNNILICKMLGIKNPRPCNVGFVGDLQTPRSLEKLTSEIDKKLCTRSQTLAFGPDKIRRIGIISGGSSRMFEAALKQGAEAYLCGDLREEVVRAAEENQIHIINAGHYNTEKAGIQSLGTLVGRKFKIPVEFVDIPCEV